MASWRFKAKTHARGRGGRTLCEMYAASEVRISAELGQAECVKCSQRLRVIADRGMDYGELLARGEL